MSTGDLAAGHRAVPPDYDKAAAWTLTLLLSACLTLAYIDRAVINLLAQSIKTDLNISDTRLALLQGLAFTVSFTLATVPGGWLADRFDRRRLIALGVVAWSVMTGLCGLAQNFEMLFLARVGVGLFEAVLTPCALAMIAAALPVGPRATAMSVYHMGTVLGVGLSLILGGLLLEWLGSPAAPVIMGLGNFAAWQQTFLLLALPGFALAAVVLFFAREPRQAVETRPANAPRGLAPFMKTHGAVFIAVTAAMTLMLSAVAGATAWAPIFLVRDWGLSPGEIARTYGPISVVFGLVGTFFGGWLASRLARSGRGDASLRATLFAAVGATLFGIIVYQTDRGALGWSALAAITFFAPMPFGVAFAMLADLTPPEIRGRITALYVFVLNAVGHTLGPLMVGLTNDTLFKSEAALGWSLALLWAVCGGAAIVILSLAARGFRRAADGEA